MTPAASGEGVQVRQASVARVEGGGLALDYEVVNAGPRAIWLYLLFETERSGRYRLEPARAYVEVLPRGALLVSKAAVPVPSGLEVEFPEVPCLLRLEPGASLAQRAVILAPLRTRLPYPQPPSPGLALEQVREVTLRVGYLPDHVGLKLYQGTDTSGTAFVYPDYGQALALQRRLTVGPLAVTQELH